MKRGLVFLVFCWAVVLGDAVGPTGTVRAALQDDDQSVRALLQHLEEIVQQGDSAGFRALLAEAMDPGEADEFVATELRPGATRAVIRERGRDQLPGAPQGAAFRLIVDAFVESGDRARVATWRLDLKKTDEAEWRVTGQKRLSGIDNIHRLSVNRTKQFSASNFTLRAEDLELTLTDGSVFVIDIEEGVTGLVLLGRGNMRFRPTPDTEKGQVRIFSGADTLESRFDTAYVRVGDVDLHADLTLLVARPVDPRELRRAEQLFREESVKAFGLQLRELSPDAWSLLPAPGDFLAEVRTRRFDTLTYSRARSEPEDITLFDRRQQRKIAAYQSVEKLASSGRFYNEDDLAEYDILDHDIELVVDPDRQWIEGRAKVRLEVRAPLVVQITLTLAESLVVHSVVSDEFGWLFSVRVKNQSSLLVSLPIPLERHRQLTLTIVYGGRLPSQPATRETLALEQGGQDRQTTRTWSSEFYAPMSQVEASYLYSNRSYWYPQAPISDYATATMRISIPAALGCVGTGEMASGSPTLVRGKQTSQNRKLYRFTATRPVRYLAFLISRFTRVDQFTLAFDDGQDSDDSSHDATEPAGPPAVGGLGTLDVTIDSNPDQYNRGRESASPTADIARFYQNLVGDAPYESFALAVVESDLPGGHSPGYFAMLNQPRADTPVVWRNDPANFEGFPEFFLAHELAHQWWGQAVGWGNYHEQWLSEGFAQYFAALYAQHHRGDDSFAAVLRHMRRWSLEQSHQGPVYLGYRLGHIRNEGRVFRALVYNKGALVLHMLRRLIGDEAFFRAIRRFYVESRFRKAATDELRVAMEREAGRPLGRFFDRWIYGSTLPRLAFSYRVEAAGKGQEVVLHFEQSGELFDLPVRVTLQYGDRRSVDVVVSVTDQTVDKRVALDGALRSVEISRDDGLIAEISKVP